MTVTYKFPLGAVVAAALACGANAEMRKDIEFAKPGGVALTLDASMPDIGTGPYPAVIVVHGGGFTHGDKTTYVQPLFQPLTAARFVWFSINYRLAPQYPFPAAADDVISALEWVRTHAAEYKVDPKRIALMGESAGAFLVDYAAAKAPKEDHIAAVVSFYGPHDLLAEARTAGGGKIDAGLAGFAGVTELNAEGEKRLREISPFYLLHRHMPPFLLIHGTADEMVPFEQSVHFRRVLEDHNSKVELYAVEGGKHGVGAWEKAPSQQEYKAMMIEWLRSTLR